MTKAEYEQYKQDVEEFFQRKGIRNLSVIESCEEPFFSWHSCECCGDSFGGDRYECNGYNPTTGEVQEYGFICPNCVYFAENGCLDDQTMWEIDNEGETK